MAPVLDEDTRAALLILRSQFGISWGEAREMSQQELALLFDGLEEAFEQQATDGGTPSPPTVPMGGDAAEVPSQLAALPP